MKKYYYVFRNEFKRKFQYKLDFFAKRLQMIVAFLVLYFVWINAASGKTFEGYSKLELVTYVVGATIAGAIVFGAQSRHVSFEINTGLISSVLVKPVNYFWYTFARQLSERIISLVFAVLEITALFFFLRFDVVPQTSPGLLIAFCVSLLLGMFLFHLLDFGVSLFAFWSREAYGPKWIFEQTALFASGLFFPLNILSPILSFFLTVLPLSLVIYFPLTVYLGRIPTSEIILGIFAQCVWIFSISLLVMLVWRRGLRDYTSEGI